MVGIIQNEKLGGTDLPDYPTSYAPKGEDFNITNNRISDLITSNLLKNCRSNIQILTHAGQFDNGEGQVVDRFTSSLGANETVNIPFTNVTYNSGDDHYELPFTETTPISDFTQYSATSSFNGENMLIHTYTVGDIIIEKIETDNRVNQFTGNAWVVWTYTDTTTDTSSTQSISTSFATKTWINPFPIKTVDTVAVWSDTTDATSSTFYVKNFYGIKYDYASSSIPFIIIEATSISSHDDFEINDCKIIKFDSGKWQLTCESGTLEEKRSKLYMTLFYGTDGSDPRASSTYITGITGIKTNITRDVGKQAYYAEIIGTDTGTHETGTIETDITFNDTSTNTDFSSWSRVNSIIEHVDVPTIKTSWQIPDDTDINSVSAETSSQLSDEIGTDTTADEINNPATAALFTQTAANGSLDGYGIIKSFFLCSGTVSFNTTTTGATTKFTNSQTDFNIDNSIPVFTATTETIKHIIVCDSNTTAIEDDTIGFVYKSEGTIPSDTSKTIIISDGTNEATELTLNQNGESPLIYKNSLINVDNLMITETLISDLGTNTPTTKAYSLNEVKTHDIN